MGNADNAAFIGDQVFHVNLAFLGHELGKTWRPVLVANFAQLLLNDGKDALLLCENIA